MTISRSVSVATNGRISFFYILLILPLRSMLTLLELVHWFFQMDSTPGPDVQTPSKCPTSHYVGPPLMSVEPPRPPRTQRDCPSVLCSGCVGGPRIALAWPRTSHPATLPPYALLTLRVGETGCCRQQTMARVEPST